MTNNTKLKWQDVRWLCDIADLDFKSTKDVNAVSNIIGQKEALDALEYSIESRAFGQNAFVRGLHGSGRLNMICEFLHNRKPSLHEKHDQCYVANFSQPDRPKLITLSPGEAKLFKRVMKKFAEFVTKELNGHLDGDSIKAAKEKIETQAQKDIKKISDPFEKKLEKNSLKLLNIKVESFWTILCETILLCFLVILK